MWRTSLGLGPGKVKVRPLSERHLSRNPKQGSELAGQGPRSSTPGRRPPLRPA